MSGGYGGDEHVVSPDGTYVAVVVQQGDMARNTRQFSLLLFHTPDLFLHPKPDTAAVFATSSNRPGIAQIQWLSNEALSFLAESPGELPQVYALDLRTKKLVQRTQAAQAVTVFKATNDGETIIYATAPPPADTSGFAAMRLHGFAIPPDVPITDVIAGKWDQIAPNSRRRLLHIVRNGSEVTIAMPSAEQYGISMLDEAFAENNLLIAPSGDVALVRYRPTAAPLSWSQYEEDDLRKHLTAGSRYPWWIVLDLHTGAAWPLTGAPNVSHTMPIWTPDGQAVLLVDDFLPLSGAGPAEFALRSRTRLTAEVDARTGAAKLVAAPTADRLVKSPIEVQEGPAEPWTLVALNPGNRKKQLIYDPNPALRMKRLARVTLLSWTTRPGAELTAGLYWPIDYRKEQRYPLLIQTHGFQLDRFAPDGYSTTGYAGQPLAANGVMVVQAFQCTRNCKSEEGNARSEGENIKEGLEALIDHLDKLALIDRNKVALQGYSRSCFHELYFLTHSDYRISAMTCTDGIDESYLQYLFFVPHIPGLAKDFDAHNGGPPFGPALKSWMVRAPGFNLDRIHTPLQLTAVTDGLTLLEEWEPFAGLTVQGKPVELRYLPDAAHNIVKPWERFASQQGAVDWFRFWLQGYERDRPVTAAEETADTLRAQYARWRKLRAQQASEVATR